MNYEAVILGSGSSGGVPRADGNWGACDPAEPKNRRSRCSLLVRTAGEGGAEAQTTVLVDTSPDLRTQTAAAGVRRLDAVLYTHDHADQAHGIDDIRAFVIGQKLKRIPAYMDGPTRATLTRRFDYIFETQDLYPALAEARDLPPHGTDWSIDGPGGLIPVRSFDQDHGRFAPRLPLRAGRLFGRCGGPAGGGFRVPPGPGRLVRGRASLDASSDPRQC
jgi:phosphoribosyl 1,2-cyclic phosphate phosphodiesterase